MAELTEALDSANWAETIRMLRKAKEWSQADLAERLDIHPQAISEIERGRERLTLERLNRLLDALGYKGQVSICEKQSNIVAEWGTTGAKDPRRRRIIASARQLAEKLAEILYRKFDVEKVYCIGSLAADNGKHFQKDSDIDLVVKGMKPEKLISARSTLEMEVLDSVPKDRHHSFDLIQNDDYEGDLNSLVEENNAVLIPSSVVDKRE